VARRCSLAGQGLTARRAVVESLRNPESGAKRVTQLQIANCKLQIEN
jgi:hypothetical protein